MNQRGFKKTKLSYYFKVWFVIFKTSLSRAATYRVEVITRGLRGIFLVTVQVIFIRAVLGNAQTFAGWTLDEMYLLAGVFNSINYFSWALFSINLWRLEEKVLKGEFDFLLLKPLSSIFTTAFSDFFIDDAVSGVSGLILIGYYVVRHYAEFTVVGVAGGLVAIFSAFLIWFSLELLFASFDFLMIKNGLREIKKQIAGIGKYPADIWGSNKYIFYTLIPVAFVASVPARVLTGYYDWKYVLASLGISITFFLIARVVWFKCLKKYTSASG